MRHCLWLLLPACAVAVLAGPAQARPRDDALSGAFRCAAIADSRAWLDCYYGAAQPVRAALSLSPALAGQIKLATSPPVGGSPHDETVRDEVMSGAAGCNRVAGDRPWLDCYYASAAPMRVQLGLSSPAGAARAPAPGPAPQTAFVPPPPPRPAAPAGLPPKPRPAGLFAGLFSTPRPIVRNMPMQSFTLDSKGAFTVTLADGQVWEQLDEDEIYHPARWHKDAQQMLVSISPDTMHTFSMQVSDENRFYKVRRIH